MRLNALRLTPGQRSLLSRLRNRSTAADTPGTVVPFCFRFVHEHAPADEREQTQFETDVAALDRAGLLEVIKDQRGNTAIQLTKGACS